jgi:hypothetical protein
MQNQIIKAPSLNFKILLLKRDIKLHQSNLTPCNELSLHYILVQMSNALSLLKILLNMMWLLKLSINQNLIMIISNSAIILKVQHILKDL